MLRPGLARRSAAGGAPQRSALQARAKHAAIWRHTAQPQCTGSEARETGATAPPHAAGGERLGRGLAERRATSDAGQAICV